MDGDLTTADGSHPEQNLMPGYTAVGPSPWRSPGRGQLWLAKFERQACPERPSDRPLSPDSLTSADERTGDFDRWHPAPLVCSGGAEQGMAFDKAPLVLTPDKGVPYLQVPT